MNPESIEELRRIVQRKTLGCPFFIAGSIRPLITYLEGRISWREVTERACMGRDAWNRCPPEDQADLEGSYYQERDVILAILRALERNEPTTPEGDAALRTEILSIVQNYAAQPEAERKCFFL